MKSDKEENYWVRIILFLLVLWMVVLSICSGIAISRINKFKPRIQYEEYNTPLVHNEMWIDWEAEEVVIQGTHLYIPYDSYNDDYDGIEIRDNDYINTTNFPYINDFMEVDGIDYVLTKNLIYYPSSNSNYYKIYSVQMWSFDWENQDYNVEWDTYIQPVG